MPQVRRTRSDRSPPTGGALVRLLACVALVVVALAAWRHHGRAALADPPAVASTPATGKPATARAPIRINIPAQQSADDPWAEAPRPSGKTVYQCTLRDGSNFQTGPCPEGAVTEWSREATPDDLALIAAHAQAELRARQGLQAQHAELMQRISEASTAAVRQAQQVEPSAAGAPGAGELRAANCAAARRYRDAQLAKAGMDRDFDLIRKLDDIVYDACKSG